MFQVCQCSCVTQNLITAIMRYVVSLLPLGPPDAGDEGVPPTRVRELTPAMGPAARASFQTFLHRVRDVLSEGDPHTAWK